MLAQTIDGSIVVRSQPGVGSEFTLILRKTEEEPVETPYGSLIIEDNRINLKLMTYLVQAAGIAVTTAADGKGTEWLFCAGRT